MNVESGKIVYGSEKWGKEEDVGQAEGIKWNSCSKDEIDRMENQ